MRTLQWFVNKAAAQRMDWVKSKSQGTQSTCLWLFHRYLKSWWVQSTAHAHSLSRGATEGMWQPVLREFDKISFQYFCFELANSLSKKYRLVEQRPQAAWLNDRFIFQLKEYSLVLSLQWCPPHKKTPFAYRGNLLIAFLLTMYFDTHSHGWRTFWVVH